MPALFVADPDLVACLMTEVRLFSATSLDGFVADEEGDAEWLEAYKPRILTASGFMEKIGAVVMGRRTFELIRAFGDWPYSGRRAYILTSQELWDLPENTVFVREGMGAAIQAAREATNKDVWVAGGAVTMQSALEDGFIDTIEICVLPVVLGSGLSLLNGLEQRAELMFDGMEVFPDGIVKLRYLTSRGGAGEGRLRSETG